jgi:hypothetical protein
MNARRNLGIDFVGIPSRECIELMVAQGKWQVPVAQTPGLTKRTVGRETPLAVGGTIRMTQGTGGSRVVRNLEQNWASG